MSTHLRSRACVSAFACLLAALALLGLLASPHAARAQGAPALTTLDETERVGPGITLRTLETIAARGWTSAHVLEVDLAREGVGSDLLWPGRVAAAEPLSAIADREGAVAGVNGDFFDINNTKAPLGVEIQGGDFIKAPNPDWTRTAGVGTDGLGRLASLSLDGRVTLPDGEQALAALNQANLSAGGIGMYTTLWGTATRAGAVQGAAKVREVLVRGGYVERVSETAGSGPIPRDGSVLLGREAGADALAGLEPGDRVSVAYRPVTDAAAPFRWAVSGNRWLVQDGEPVAGLDDAVTAPRTAIGFDDGGETMLLAVADGRQPSVAGPTDRQMAELMDGLGVEEALNLDGGGSSTLLARAPGMEAATVRNVPSDGVERPVPNGVGLFLPGGSGTLNGIALEAPGGLEVFPGLSRRLVARGHDETDGPAPLGDARWSVSAGSVDADGLVRAPDGGDRLAVRVRSGGVEATEELEVLGRLDRLEAAPGRVSLATEAAAPQDLRLTGRDRDGHDAPIEPGDVRLDYDRSVVSVEPAGTALRVTPKARGGTVLTLTVQGETLILPVTVGLDTVPVSDFEDPARWAFSHARAPNGSLSGAEGRSGQGVKIAYDFTASTATRTSGPTPKEPLVLPGQPQAVGWWIKSDGKGAWTSATLVDSAGKSTNLYGPYLTGEPGWRYIEVPLPTAGVAYPVRLASLRVIETVAARQYAGEVTFDDLVVKNPPDLAAPEAPLERDRQIDADGELAEDRWTFATLSDIQFTADPATKPLQDLARERLRAIVAARPDFLIVNGDFLDEGKEADIAVARQILSEELDGRLPYHYVPGNHETYGVAEPDKLGPFKRAFGTNRRTFDHKGVRFFLLDSSLGSLRTSDYAQLVELREGLLDAAEDPSITGVVLAAHHPVEDPDSAGNSQLTDRKEAALIRTWLGDFVERSGGKGAAMLGSHAQIVDVRRRDGATYMVLPAGGKAPYGTPDRGGFNGWARFGVRPGGGTELLRADVRPAVASIDLRAPAALRVGDEATVTATAVQPRTNLTIPLRYPASVKWGGENVEVAPDPDAGDRRQARAAGAVAVLDPVTGELDAVRPGRATVTVTAGGVTDAQALRVTRRAVTTPPGGGTPPPGGNPPPAGGVPDRTSPVIRGLRLRLGRRPYVRMRVSERATVQVTLTRKATGRRAGGRCRLKTRANRDGRACRREVTVLRRTRRVGPGLAEIRVPARRLRDGRHRLTARATDPAGNRSRTVTTTVRVR